MDDCHIVHSFRSMPEIVLLMLLIFSMAVHSRRREKSAVVCVVLQQQRHYGGTQMFQFCFLFLTTFNFKQKAAVDSVGARVLPLLSALRHDF